MKTNKLTTIVFFLGMLCASCTKDWLDKKPDISLVVPTSLTDFQALLDNTLLAFNAGNCAYGEIGSDNYYVTSTVYSTLIPDNQNAYIWNLVNYATNSSGDWARPYTQIYYANVVLSGLTKVNLSASNESDYNNVKGSALFYRSFAYYDLAQIFAKPYDNTTANTDPGLPLRTIPNLVNDQPRASVADTYAFLINDLKTSINLLPVVPKYKTRPSKPAAYGLLARTYLSMGDYTNAYLYADSCLQLYNTLIPYSSFNLASSIPIPKYNDEVIFFNNCTAYTIFGTTDAIVDSNLYASYNDNDLRKTVFFKKDASGVPRIFGRYSGSSIALFDGLAVDEIFMIRAEAGARIGKLSGAINDLNTLLATRWKPGTYTNLTVSTADEAISLILQERRKELCFRGLRWSDLRRLNKDPKYAITLTRLFNGKTYTLAPNDNRYVYQIPSLETNYNQDIVQNHL